MMCLWQAYPERESFISSSTKSYSQQVTICSVLLDDCRDLSLLSQYESLLSPSERDQWGRFAFDKDRHCYLVSRALLRTVLAERLSLHPADIRFGKTQKGKPFLDHPNGGQLSFNLSHCADMVVLAVATQGQVGIDVELRAREAPMSIVRHCFTRKEAQLLLASAPETLNDAFFALWTLKESYIKATGQGLSTQLNSFGFDLSHPKEIALCGGPEWQDCYERWWLVQWAPSPAHVAALCIELGHNTMSPDLIFHQIIPMISVRSVETIPTRMTPRFFRSF